MLYFATQSLAQLSRGHVISSQVFVGTLIFAGLGAISSTLALAAARRAPALARGKSAELLGP